MKRTIGAAILLAAMQAAFATASADQERGDRDRDRDQERSESDQARSERDQERYERDQERDRDRAERDRDRDERNRERGERNRERDRERERRSSHPYFFAAGGTINDHRIEYETDVGDVEIQAAEGETWTIGWAHRHNDRTRSETTLTYSEQDIESVRNTVNGVTSVYTTPSDIQVFTLNWMNYFDFNRDGFVRPYFGTGLGLSNVDLNDQVESGAGIALSGRFALGVRLMFGENAALFAEARYDAHIKDIEDGFGFSGNHSLMYLGGESAVAGLKFGF